PRSASRRSWSGTGRSATSRGNSSRAVASQGPSHSARKVSSPYFRRCTSTDQGGSCQLSAAAKRPPLVFFETGEPGGQAQLQGSRLQRGHSHFIAALSDVAAGGC